jgi:hypothetical protein
MTQDTETRIAALEARLQELEADRAIRELLSRYGFNADQGRSDAWVALYTDDAVLDIALDPSWQGSVGLSDSAPAGDASPPADDIVRREGHDELRQFILDPRLHKRIEGRSLHLMNANLVTHITGDAATAESYNLTIVRDGSQMQVMNGAINRWELNRVNGRWLIRRCLRRRPGAAGFDQVLVTQS